MKCSNVRRSLAFPLLAVPRYFLPTVLCLFFCFFIVAFCFYVLYICHIFFGPSVSLWSFALFKFSLLYSSSVSFYLTFFVRRCVSHVPVAFVFFIFDLCHNYFTPKVVVFIIVLFLPHSGRDSTETTCMTS